MIKVDVVAAKRTDSGVEIVVLVDLGEIAKSATVTIPSYVITELLDAAGVEYTTRDE